MSPEQVRGEPVDKRTDIWAFGVVLYEMLTGARLFEGKTVSDTLASVLRDEPQWDRAPAKVQKVLRACLQREPKRRLRDIGDAWQLLEEGKANQTQAPRPFNRRLAWATSGTLVLLLAGVSFLSLRQPAQKPAGQASPLRLQLTLPDVSQQKELSPNGRKLLYVAPSPNGRPALWVQSLDSSDARLLRGTDNVTGGPFWSPDSRFIAFSAEGKLKKIDARGGPPEVICETEANRGGTWNNDDVLILGSATGLVRVSLTDRVPLPLTKLDPSGKDYDHIRPRFLPDGRHFVYVRNASDRQSNAIFAGLLDATPEQQPSKPLNPDPIRRRPLFSRLGLD